MKPLQTRQDVGVQDVDDEYREIELYLRQAQDEIGQALSNLSLNTTGLGQDENANNALDFTNRRRSLQDITHVQRSLQDITHVQRNTLQPAPTSAFEHVQPRGIQNVDFLAIFAQNNLVAGNTAGTVQSYNNPKDEGWNRTLPTPQRVPAERPKTLTPPPRFPGNSRNSYKNRDWRLYVRGEYLFSPIRSEEESSCSTWSTEDRGDSSYMESTKESGASTSEFSAAELSAESSSTGAETKDVAAAIQRRFEKLSESDVPPALRSNTDVDTVGRLKEPSPVVAQTVNHSSGHVSEYDNLRSTEDEDGSEPDICDKHENNTRKMKDGVLPTWRENNRNMEGKEGEGGEKKQHCDANCNQEISNQKSGTNQENPLKTLTSTVNNKPCDIQCEKYKVQDVDSKGNYRAPNPVSQTLDSRPDSDTVQLTSSNPKSFGPKSRLLDSHKASDCTSQSFKSPATSNVGNLVLDTRKASDSVSMTRRKVDNHKNSDAVHQKLDCQKSSNSGSKNLIAQKISGPSCHTEDSQNISEYEGQSVDCSKPTVSQVIDSCKAFNSVASTKSGITEKSGSYSPLKQKLGTSTTSSAWLERKKVVPVARNRRTSEPSLSPYTDPTTRTIPAIRSTQSNSCDTSVTRVTEKHHAQLKANKRLSSPEKDGVSPEKMARNKRSRSKSDPLGMIPQHIQQRAWLRDSGVTPAERRSEDVGIWQCKELHPILEPLSNLIRDTCGVLSPQSNRKNAAGGILSPRSERRKSEKVSRSTQTFKGTKVDNRHLPRAVVKPERSGVPVTSQEISKNLNQVQNSSLDLDNNNKTTVISQESENTKSLKEDVPKIQDPPSDKLHVGKTLQDVIGIIEPPALKDPQNKGQEQQKKDTVKKENEINSSKSESVDVPVKVEVHVTSCDDDDISPEPLDQVLAVIPRGYGSRERRVRVMPAIAEDDRQTEEEIDNDEAFESSSNSSLKKSHARTLSSSSSATTVSDGPQSPESVAPPISQSDSSQSVAGKTASLLDSLHRKYYPDQYKGKARSAEALCGGNSTGSLEDDVNGHCKSASFAGTLNVYSKDNVIDRLSDSQIGAKLSALNGHSSDSTGSPGSTLSPPTSRRTKDKNKTSAKKRDLSPPEGSTSKCTRDYSQNQDGQERGESQSERERAVKQLEKRLKNLRSIYGRICKAGSSGSSGRKMTARNQWLATQLAFLKTYIKPRPASSNMVTEEMQVDQSDDESQEEEDDDDDNEDLLNALAEESEDEDDEAEDAAGNEEVEKVGVPVALALPVLPAPKADKKEEKSMDELEATGSAKNTKKKRNVSKGADSNQAEEVIIVDSGDNQNNKAESYKSTKRPIAKKSRGPLLNSPGQPVARPGKIGRDQEDRDFLKAIALSLAEKNQNSAKKLKRLDKPKKTPTIDMDAQSSAVPAEFCKSQPDEVTGFLRHIESLLRSISSRADRLVLQQDVERSVYQAVLAEERSQRQSIAHTQTIVTSQSFVNPTNAPNATKQRAAVGAFVAPAPVNPLPNIIPNLQTGLNYTNLLDPAVYGQFPGGGSQISTTQNAAHQAGGQPLGLMGNAGLQPSSSNTSSDESASFFAHF